MPFGATTITQSRAEIFERLQVAFEATAGTAVAANNILLAISGENEPQIPSEMVQPQGYKAPTDAVLQAEWTKLNFKGMLSFNDILFFLSSGLCVPAVTTPNTATNTRQYLFKPNMKGPDTIATLSVEKGSTAGGESFAYGVTSDMDFSFAPKSADVKGMMFGQEFYDGVTITATGLNEVPIKAVSPNKLDVFVGDSVGGLIQLDDAYKFDWGFKGRHNPNIVMNSTRPSFKNTVEGDFGLTGQIVMEQDSVANGYMADLRRVKHKFARMIATGSLIETGFNYKIQCTFPFIFRNPKRGENAKVYAGTYDIQPVYDATFGGAIEVIVLTDYQLPANSVTPPTGRPTLQTIGYSPAGSP